MREKSLASRPANVQYIAGPKLILVGYGSSSVIPSEPFASLEGGLRDRGISIVAGVGLARSGVGVAIVGNPDQVAAKLRAYQALGISTFILSGYPHLEECRRFGELVMPLLRQRSESNAAAPAAALKAGVAPVT